MSGFHGRARSPHRRFRAPHRQDRADIERPGQEPRAGVSKHRGGFIEQALRLGRRRRSRGRPPPARSARFPVPHGIASAWNPSMLRANRSRAAVDIADGVFDMPEQMLGLHDDFHVAGLAGERQGARRARCGRARVRLACTTSSRRRRALSTRHAAGSDGRFRICSYHCSPSACARESARSTSAPTRCWPLRPARPRSMSHVSAPR